MCKLKLVFGCMIACVVNSLFFLIQLYIHNSRGFMRFTTGKASHPIINYELKFLKGCSDIMKHSFGVGCQMGGRCRILAHPAPEVLQRKRDCGL
jgi:hypothetical protein